MTVPAVNSTTVRTSPVRAVSAVRKVRKPTPEEELERKEEADAEVRPALPPGVGENLDVYV
jgi:hypothetical protein